MTLYLSMLITQRVMIATVPPVAPSIPYILQAVMKRIIGKQNKKDLIKVQLNQFQ